MSAKKLKLTANLRIRKNKVLVAGVYEGAMIPDELMAEFQKGVGYIEEISVIPSVKAPVTPTAPAPEKKVAPVEAPPEPSAKPPVKPPAKPAARKTSAKGRRTAKKTSRK